MGEIMRIVGPLVDQIYVQNAETEVNDIEVTIRKPANFLGVHGQIRWNGSAPNAARVTESMIGLNGVLIEASRKRRVQDYTAGSFKVTDTFIVLEGVAPGDRITLFGLQSVDATTQAAALFSVLTVIHYGPEFRVQGFLEDTG